MKIDIETCVGCGICIKDCPLGVISLKDKKAFIGEGCVECRTCLKVCPTGSVEDVILAADDVPTCGVCPVQCRIPEGRTGACGRFVNKGGELIRTQVLVKYAEVKPELAAEPEPCISEPSITAIGAGGTYPDYVPAPYIVSDERDGVEVVTVVTEAPLSYSGVKVKIDTDFEVGKEGDEIKFEGRTVGMVETEEYGSKILAVGGVNRLTGKNGFAAARAVAAIANREAIKLRVKGGAKLELKVGEAPVINGEKVERMRVGCGSATAGLFATFFKEAADEVIVLDHHITSLFTHHAAGRCLGLSPQGLDLVFRKSTPGRFFGNHGAGWGGTDITDPIKVLAPLDKDKLNPGMRLLITETTGRNYALYELDDNYVFRKHEPGEKVLEAADAIKESCQASMVSAMYVGGVGGSARGGVARYPLRLTKAVHGAKANLTCGGAKVFVMPGGGITFIVDVEQVRRGAFTWVPTPATVAPIEYTMRLDDYRAMGGHVEAVKPFAALEPVPWSQSKS